MAETVKNRPQELTKAELEIMQVIWQKEKVLVHDILAELPEPKPAYNTVSTIVRILKNKGFVSHKAYGRTYEYFPVVAKKEFTLPDGSRLTYPVTQAMVVMQHDRGTSFDGYQNMNEFVQRAYKEIRNDLATEIFGKPLADLTHSERQIIYQAIPMNVSQRTTGVGGPSCTAIRNL